MDSSKSGAYRKSIKIYNKKKKSSDEKQTEISKSNSFSILK
jgi:hypothetical protein